MSEDVQGKVEEIERMLTDVRITQARHDGNIGDILTWREQFQKNINDTLNKMDGKIDKVDSKIDKEMREVGRNLQNLNDKIDANNKELYEKMDKDNKELSKKLEQYVTNQQDLFQKAKDKLPLWASTMIVVLLSLLPVAVTITYYSMMH